MKENITGYDTLVAYGEHHAPVFTEEEHGVEFCILDKTGVSCSTCMIHPNCSGVKESLGRLPFVSKEEMLKYIKEHPENFI